MSKYESWEPKPEFIQPPPLVAIGHPRLGHKPRPLKLNPYKKFNLVLLVVFGICMFGLGFVMGVML